MAYNEKEAKRKYYLANCEKIKQYQRDFRQREDFPAKHAIHTKTYRDKNKRIVFDHYGNACACCGETQKVFLSIDHINGGGSKHRKEICGSYAGGLSTYLWIIKNNFPPEFQILCMNCNWGRAHNNGVCPHKE